MVLIHHLKVGWHHMSVPKSVPKNFFNDQCLQKDDGLKPIDRKVVPFWKNQVFAIAIAFIIKSSSKQSQYFWKALTVVDLRTYDRQNC